MGIHRRLGSSFLVATVASPAGVSGAVLLLPFQVSILGTASPAVTPTNLLYNVVATPGALYRYWRQHQTGRQLTRILVGGTLPGVVAGSIIRVELVRGLGISRSSSRPFLIPWSVAPRLSTNPSHKRQASAPLPWRAAAIAAVVGCIGGIYGIGGGSILAPILIASGRPPSDVAPATLASTFVTSVAGVITFLVLAAQSPRLCRSGLGSRHPLGIGGLVGSYSARVFSRDYPEMMIRRVLAVLVLAIGVRYAWLAS